MYNPIEIVLYLWLRMSHKNILMVVTGIEQTRAGKLFTSSHHGGQSHSVTITHRGPVTCAVAAPSELLPGETQILNQQNSFEQ